MPIRLPTTIEYPKLMGVDDTSPIGSKDLDIYLSIGRNCKIVDDDLVFKRNGYTRFNSVSDDSTRRVRQGFYFSTVPWDLVYTEDSLVTGSTGRLGRLNGTGVFTNFKTGLKDSIKPVFIQARTRVLMFNGVDDLVIDSSGVTRQIGITAPNSAPTINTTIAGSLVLGGAYLAAYSYYNSITGAESTPTPTSVTLTAGTTAGTSGLRINVTPGSALTADTIRIYRSVAGGSELFWNKDISITSSTADLTEGDAALTFSEELDNSRPPLAPYAVLNDSRVFIAGMANNPNRIQYSKIGINGPMLESFQVLDFADTNPNDGDRIVGLGQANNYVIVLKNNSVGRLTRVDFSVQGVELVGSTKYVYEEISKGITAVSHHAGVTIDNWFVWLGKENVYATDGEQIIRLGRRIVSTIKTINFAQSAKFSAINDRNNQEFLFSVCSSNNLEPDFQIVGNYRDFPQGEIKFTYNTPGDNTATHPGIQAGCFWESFSNNNRVYYFGTSSALGRVYNYDTGTSDDTLGIFWDVRLGWLAGANKAQNKFFHSFYVFIFGNGANYNLEHTFERNNAATVIAQASTSVQSQANSLWGSPNWGAFNWGGLDFSLVKFFPRKRAYLGRYGFHNYNADQPMAVKGITGVYQAAEIHR